MAAISNRSPEVKVVYNKNGVRVEKFFTDPYKARAFYVQQSKLGNEPEVKKVSS